MGAKNVYFYLVFADCET